ncbi:MAG: EamA family transporter [Erysipelotrichaceae bacterium]
MWMVMAILSALFAGATSVLAKCGIKQTDSDVATAIRTGFVLIFAWLMVFVKGSFSTISTIDSRSLLFIVLSGLATGASWICFYKGLSLGNVNKVVALDKSSTIITILLAIVLFNERNNLIIKLFSTALIGLGIYLMIEKKAEDQLTDSNSWMIYGFLSAIFASLTSILAKIGIVNVDSTLATAIRTIVVLIMSWLIVFLKKKNSLAKNIDKKEMVFLILSAIATGMSWLCYYYAISKGIVSIVVPIDKLSIVVVVIFSAVFFKEKLSRKALIGLILMVIGTLLMTIAG